MMIVLTGLLVQASSMPPSPASQPQEKSHTRKCHGLSLMGGGVKGNYETGALQSLYDHLPKGEVAWDVATGVSIGACNAATIGVYDIGDEGAAIK